MVAVTEKEVKIMTVDYKKLYEHLVTQFIMSNHFEQWLETENGNSYVPLTKEEVIQTIPSFIEEHIYFIENEEFKEDCLDE